MTLQTKIYKQPSSNFLLHPKIRRQDGNGKCLEILRLVSGVVKYTLLSQNFQ